MRLPIIGPRNGWFSKKIVSSLGDCDCDSGRGGGVPESRVQCLRRVPVKEALRAVDLKCNFKNRSPPDNTAAY